jgi:predicted dehydrogenase
MEERTELIPDDKNPSESENRRGIRRRDLLKGLATLPVLGFFGFEFWRKLVHDRRKKRELFSQLNVAGDAPAMLPAATNAAGDLIRLGVVGFGARGEDLAKSLGFAHPDWIQRNRDETRLQDWLAQEDLNVQIVGICDVFDLRAERATAAVTNTIRPSGAGSFAAPKRFRTFAEMAASPEIDAIIITTPDFHHAWMTIAAVNEAKHVYCEKCMSRTEDEVNKVEAAVKAAQKNRGVVFQLGHQNSQSAAYAKAYEVLSKGVLGKITLVEVNTNRNSPDGAWVRHLDANGNPRPGNPDSLDWREWLGPAPEVPFDMERYYNWTKYWDYATGLSGQLLCHEFDSVNGLLGLGIPKACVASGGIYYYKDGREIPDVFHAAFEFPNHDLTVLYSATLASDKPRARVFMGHDGWMEMDNSLSVYADQNSTKYKQLIDENVVHPERPMLSFQPGLGRFDAITSASQQYYASRGLMYTYQGNRRVDLAYLHLREWLAAIRDGGPVSCPIARGIEVTMACHMATKSYREQRRVEWDPISRKIV